MYSLLLPANSNPLLRRDFIIPTVVILQLFIRIKSHFRELLLIYGLLVRVVVQYRIQYFNVLLAYVAQTADAGVWVF